MQHYSGTPLVLVAMVLNHGQSCTSHIMYVAWAIVSNKPCAMTFLAHLFMLAFYYHTDAITVLLCPGVRLCSL